MLITVHTIITAASLLGAIMAILAVVFAIYKWYLKMEAVTAEITEIKKENAMICFALSACLDGLQQLGANHSVPIAKDKLDKYLNVKAHK